MSSGLRAGVRSSLTMIYTHVVKELRTPARSPLDMLDMLHKR